MISVKFWIGRAKEPILRFFENAMLKCLEFAPLGFGRFCAKQFVRYGTEERLADLVPNFRFSLLDDPTFAKIASYS